MKLRAVVAVAIAACGVRAPHPIDVLALTREQGTEGARRTLAARVVEDPHDVQARLALAELADKTNRPGEALAQLEAVETEGGPLGVRWHADDRARYARLLHARALARTAHGSPEALRDLLHARDLGAATTADQIAGAKLAAAVARLRHVDAGVRASGRRDLVAVGVADTGRFAAALGDRATPAERAELGAWMWAHGARRAAYDELAAWHDAVAPHIVAPQAGYVPFGVGVPTDGDLEAAYLRALAWWVPMWLGDAPSPAPDTIVGPESCRFPGVHCAIDDALGTDGEAIVARAAIGEPDDDPHDAVAWAAIALGASLRGEGAWGPNLRARVDADTLARDPAARALVDYLAMAPSHRARAATTAATTKPPSGLAITRVVAALHAASGEKVGGDDPVVAAIATSFSAGAPAHYDDARASAVARYVAARVPDAVDSAALVAIARAFRRDPTVAERLGRDAIAASIDTAAASAAIAATFDALSDPGRARPLWQAAVDASHEWSYAEGLAEAEARASDPDAALINATTAAAASGDPGAVWARVARTLTGSGRYEHALTAARSAIDLAGPDALPVALDAAIDASRALGRDEQVDDLAAKRARLWPPPGNDRADDPSDPAAAIADLRFTSAAAGLARLWVASRWCPRDVATRAAILATAPADDPRRLTVEAELVDIAGDPDPMRGLAAAQALR